MNDKVAFVTGGSGDIGSAIARALATAGADVAILIRRPTGHCLPRLLTRCEQPEDAAWPCSSINVTRLPSTASVPTG